MKKKKKYTQIHTKPGQPNLNICVFGLPTHRKSMIPVLDIAKASPRIPLPIMALLRLKMDIPNDVFPSNWSKGSKEDITQISLS